jgi:hypothetical protein
VISPIARNTRNSVLKGAYDLLSKMNNNEEEDTIMDRCLAVRFFTAFG